MISKPAESPGLQRKEFSAKVGLTERQVLSLSELHVFNPVRPINAPNNRRYFTAEDFEAAEAVHILERLGYSFPEISRIFEERDHDLNQILESAIAQTKKRIAHDRNLVLAAEYAQSIGTSLFSFGNMDDSDIDRFANAILKSKEYRNSKRYLHDLTLEKQQELCKDITAIIIKFAEMSSSMEDDTRFSENLFRVEALVEDYVSLYSEILEASTPQILLAFGAIYSFGNGALCSQADEIGGDGTAEFMGLCFLLIWLKRMSRLVFPLVLLLNAPNSTQEQTGIVLTELFALFDTESASKILTIDSQSSTNVFEATVDLVDFIFDFAKEFSSDPDFVQALFIDRNLIPSDEQLDHALGLMNEYANKAFEGKDD